MLCDVDVSPPIFRQTPTLPACSFKSSQDACWDCALKELCKHPGKRSHAVSAHRRHYVHALIQYDGGYVVLFTQILYADSETSERV